MPVKKNYRYLILIFGFLMFTGGSKIAPGQTRNGFETPPDSAEIERLNRQIEEQKNELKKLREELKEEAELRRRQQQTLEILMQKLDKLDASLAEVTRTPTDRKIETVPAVSEKEKPAETSTAAVTTDAKTVQDQTPTPAKQADKPRNAVESGFGKIRFNGLLQGWYAGGNRGFNDTFRIRRAQLRFTGDLMPNVRWTVMVDVAKSLSLNSSTTNIDGTPVVNSVSVNQASRILQDAYITLSHFKRANVQFGQFKLPVSQEALQSSSALDTVERALFLQNRLGDVRDFGVMVFGSLNSQLDYQIGVFNGSGEVQNETDRSDQKAIAGRFVYRPDFIKGLQIGTSGVWGNGNRSTNSRRDRLGAELVYVRDKFKFKSEFMKGVDGVVHRRGYYAHFGYRFIPKLEGIFRFDMFDPDIRRENSSSTVTERDFITGVNYYFKDNNFKLQINYLRKTFTGTIVPSRNQLLVNLQTSW